MDLFWLVAATSAIALIAIVSLAFVLMRVSGLKADVAREQATALQAREYSIKTITERTEARTKLDDAQALIERLTAGHEAAVARADAARDARETAERQSALDRQALDEIGKRMEDWESVRIQSLEHSKAAVLTTATELSTKLIEDHKRESESAKKEAEIRAEALHQKFADVTKSVHALAEQNNQTKSTADTIFRALSSPGGAGHFAEIGLENTLKSFGLERGRDFAIQHSIEDESNGKRLRPDAVVFLPNDSVLVIDSKASKHLLELARVEGTPEAGAVTANLMRTMKEHLRSLASKDYKGAIVGAYRQTGRSGEILRTITVMYLPNEGMLEKIRAADPEIEKQALDEEIILAGPTGLAATIMVASIDIGLGRQVQNRTQIVDATAALLDSVAAALEHAEGVGRGIKAAATNYAKLASSVNSRLLPRARKLKELGVKPTKSKAMPGHLAAIEVVELSSQTLIEGEAEEVAAAPQLAEKIEG